jgi:hypothetical protein
MTQIENTSEEVGAPDKGSSMIELKKLELEQAKVEMLGKIFSDLIPRVAAYFEQRMMKHETPIAKTGIWVLAGLTVLITLGTGFLVYVGKLDAATFTFVIGTVLGFMLSFTRLFWKKDSE